ncbi:hypothetical protein FHS96_000290 [Sphingomonas zeicaulis]
MMPLFAAVDTMAVAMSASDRTIRENALNAMSRNAPEPDHDDALAPF